MLTAAILSSAVEMLNVIGSPAKTHRPAAEAACQLDLKAELPVAQRGGRIMTTVSVNDRPLTLVVNTGAVGIALNADVVEALNLAPKPRPVSKTRKPAPATGAGRVFAMQMLALGAEHWLWVAGAESAAPVADADGVLGMSLLKYYDVEFDFGRGVMRLYSASGCKGAFAPWTGAYQRLPSTQSEDAQFVIPVLLDGRRRRAVIDTGADVTLVDRHAAGQAGMLREAGWDPVALHRHQFRSLAVGAEIRDHPTLAIPGPDIEGADVVLGIDFLKTHGVWLSNYTGQVFIQPRSGASLASAD
jgi:predicted aspartyl protease